MMPLLFVGHGNPMHAVSENNFTKQWRALGELLPRPKAIVSISAHWETNGTFVTAMEKPGTIHDFYGFPQELFEVQYDPDGNPEFAKEISERLGRDFVKLDQSWGLDHGTWAVLKHIYPNADIPVLQISLDKRKNAAEHFELAKNLRFLRETEDILVIGSGNIVHNLRLINFRQKSGDDWAISANETLKKLVLNNENKSLIEFENLDDDVRQGIPTSEHYLPLIYFLAMKEKDERLEVFNDEVELGSISMTSFKVG